MSTTLHAIIEIKHFHKQKLIFNFEIIIQQNHVLFFVVIYIFELIKTCDNQTDNLSSKAGIYWNNLKEI